MHDPAAALTDLWDRLIAVAKRLDDEQWALPTPCAEWDVHDLLAHCAAVQIDLDGGVHVPPPDDWRPPEGVGALDRLTASGVAARRGWGPEEVRTELRHAREGHVARLQRVEDWHSGVEGPVGRTTEEGLLATRCYDLWVHLQDLRVALGQPLDIGDDSEAARTAHGYVIDRLPWLLAKPVGAADGEALRVILASPAPLDTVVAMRDGRARFERTAQAVSSTVRAAPEALTLLVSGRETPATWRSRGLLEWSGPLGERFVESARFF